jgi:hypothetical protein
MVNILSSMPHATNQQKSLLKWQRLIANLEKPMNFEKSNSLTDLAARIRSSHEAMRQILHTAVKRAMDTGDMLLEAKAQLGHGEWMPWLRDHCTLPQRTANLYMRLAKGRAVIEASGDIAGLTLNAAARLLAPPRDDEDELEKLRAELTVLWQQVQINTREGIRRYRQCMDALNDEELQQVFPKLRHPRAHLCQLLEEELQED